MWMIYRGPYNHIPLDSPSYRLKLDKESLNKYVEIYKQNPGSYSLTDGPMSYLNHYANKTFSFNFEYDGGEVDMGATLVFGINHVRQIVNAGIVSLE